MKFGTLPSSLCRIIIISDFGTEGMNIMSKFLFMPMVYEDLKETGMYCLEKKMTNEEKIW